MSIALKLTLGQCHANMHMDIVCPCAIHTPDACDPEPGWLDRVDLALGCNYTTQTLRARRHGAQLEIDRGDREKGSPRPLLHGEAFYPHTHCIHTTSDQLFCSGNLFTGVLCISKGTIPRVLLSMLLPPSFFFLLRRYFLYPLICCMLSGHSY